jgi:hypothetical protein
MEVRDRPGNCTPPPLHVPRHFIKGVGGEYGLFQCILLEFDPLAFILISIIGSFNKWF